MLAFYLILISCLLLYSGSKYFPFSILQIKSRWLKGLLVCGLLALATVLFQASFGWASGILLAVFSLSLAFSFLVFFAPYGHKYFRAFWLIIHFYLFLTLFQG